MGHMDDLSLSAEQKPPECDSSLQCRTQHYIRTTRSIHSTHSRQLQKKIKKIDQLDDDIIKT